MRLFFARSSINIYMDSRSFVITTFLLVYDSLSWSVVQSRFTLYYLLNLRLCFCKDTRVFLVIVCYSSLRKPSFDFFRKRKNYVRSQYFEFDFSYDD